MALDAVAGMQSRIVVENAGELWRETATRWGDLPEVRDLGELLVSARKTRKTLPSGQSV